MVSLQVVTTPTYEWLAKQVQGCSSRMLVSSPYVNQGLVNLTGMAPAGVSRTLVTRTDLRDFAVGASNLDTLCSLAKEGVVVRSLSNLHAKIYIFDETAALVTSANATVSGMWRNLECGLSTYDKQIVKGLARSLLHGLGAGAPPRILPYKELDALHGPLQAIKVSLPDPARIPSQDGGLAVKPTFSILDKEAIIKGFTGWRKLTFEGVLDMPQDGFRLNDLFKACEAKIAQMYPKNRHVLAKLRQQLQALKAVGIVEFVTPGYYRCTMAHS